MNSTNRDRRQNLLQKAQQSTRKSVRYIGKLQREISRRHPNIRKVMKLQRKSSKANKRAIKFLNAASVLDNGTYKTLYSQYQLL